MSLEASCLLSEMSHIWGETGQKPMDGEILESDTLARALEGSPARRSQEFHFPPRLAVHPSISSPGGEQEGGYQELARDSAKESFLKKEKKIVDSVVEHLPRQCKALGSIPRTENLRNIKLTS